MANSVYQINKGINKSIEFKGLKAQYIWYLGAGILALMIVFAALFIIGVNQYICMGIILCCGSALVFKVYEMSRKYGEHGMMKTMARRSIPKVVKCNSRKLFMKHV
ncbi:protein of unknown function [Mucilaginibacter gossypiicola]|uniref:DUF4133 domain-containing protein n=1 Tax=Mucilaginibacter gossypiicola TaxID=551995 RepID=A0A1H8HNN3_9SPHI|nr:DUF4133 domain-containing protein [Mucilaginibacter gossypiicola]SEN57703.1 protein of unknown function [Mucilaginibacter gossypiicola]